MFVQVGVVVVVLAFIGVWAKIIKQYLLGEKVDMGLISSNVCG
jgi:hypothetical protein